MNISISRIVIFTLFITIPALIYCQKEKRAPRETATIEQINKTRMEFKNFTQSYKEKMKPITITWWRKYFEAAVSGKKEDWDSVASYEIQYNNAISNKADFSTLKKIKELGLLRDSLSTRQLLLIYNEYLAKQLDTATLNAMTKLQAEIEQKYANFRAEYNGKKLSDNEIEEILSTSKDSKKLEGVWMAHKKIGPLVVKDIVNLVKMRNKAAKELGFDNFHAMTLLLSDQDPLEITRLFDELDTLTTPAFMEVKKEMDRVLAKQLGIKPEKLMPWHYQNRFFQETPKIYAVNFDKYYKNKNVVKLTEDFYTGIGLPIDDIVKKSDLYEKKGKNQHAFCTDIDRDSKDIRVLCNVKPNATWMGTLLHEFGHSVYEKYFDPTLPWVLKQPAHIFTTEAVAILLESLSSNPQWMKEMHLITDKECAAIADAAEKSLRLERLVFGRWSQVMYRFEKSMYENPDQDLNTLWWNLVEKYQMIKKPEKRNEPDWATKIHIATAPCYYHNYLIGFLFAAQLSAAIKNTVLKTAGNKNPSFANKPEIGAFLVEKVFSPGAKYYWNDMIEKATGEKLSAKYFAQQLRN